MLFFRLKLFHKRSPPEINLSNNRDIFQFNSSLELTPKKVDALEDSMSPLPSPMPSLKSIKARTKKRLKISTSFYDENSEGNISAYAATHATQFTIVSLWPEHTSQRFA